MLACTRRCAENCADERVVRARAPDCTSEAALQLGFACEILPFALLLAHLHVTLPMASSPLGNDVCMALQDLKIPSDQHTRSSNNCAILSIRKSSSSGKRK